MKVEAFLVVSTVNVIIGQRLIRKLCETKEKYFLTKPQIESLGKKIDLDRVLSLLKEEKVVAKDAAWEKIPLYKPKPSKESEDGFKGRVGIHEVLKVTNTIRELVIQEKSSSEIEAQARKEGMMTMLEDGIFKAVQGITTIEEVLRVISE